MFDQVLRLRTLADSLIERERELGQFFTVGILRSLVPGSLLIRRGDLRFRTSEELKRNPPALLGELRLGLRRIASDLHDAPMAEGEGQLVCSDARTLARHMREPTDAIITSPPYLNGTNYFRSTKIELWFLRELTSKAGPRILRDAAITSGINDVTQRKVNSPRAGSDIRAIKDVLAALREDSYDVRIPLSCASALAALARLAAVNPRLSSSRKARGSNLVNAGAVIASSPYDTSPRD